MIVVRNTALCTLWLMFIACGSNEGMDTDIESTNQVSVSATSGNTPLDIPPVEEQWDTPPQGVSNYQSSAEVKSLINGLDGDVGLYLYITAHGVVDTAWVEYPSGHSVLDSVALMEAYTWSFVPAIKNGKPVDAYVLMPYQFRSIRKDEQ